MGWMDGWVPLLEFGGEVDISPGLASSIRIVIASWNSRLPTENPLSENPEYLAQKGSCKL